MANKFNNFFLNLDINNQEEEMDSSLHNVFQNEIVIKSKENDNYVKKLKEQIEKLDKLKN